MATTTSGVIKPIVRGETREIMILLKRNGVTQNVTSDTVTLVIKSTKTDADASALLKTDADVSTYGSAGYAYFDLSPTDTDIAPGSYPIDITWYDGSQEFIVYDDTVTIKERVSDT